MDVGIVIIGRNEGKRLPLCLASVLGQTSRVVYVDSGSTDRSRDIVREAGVEVLELDSSEPFTAARARNSGWNHLKSRFPELLYLQFVDGDCELDKDWIRAGRRHLEENLETAAVSGRLRERHPESSVYNRLCDIEWNTPVGTAKACGGNAMMRLIALTECGGFDDSLIAGEEPELCFRLRERGWSISCLPAEMAQHDAAMHSLWQWWRRCRRGGFAFAQGHFLHRGSRERYYSAELRSILVWGLAIPATTVACSLLHPLGLLALISYPAQVLRLNRRFRREGIIPRTDCMPYAMSCVLSKFPSLVGLLSFHLGRLLSFRTRIIEYK